jgi:transcriptional regulator with XRE-family HTH domain
MAKDIEKGVRALAHEFGRLVANHRRRLGWSQEKLADRAEVSEGMIAKVETGATGVRFPMIVKIANALEVEPAELFCSQLPHGRLNQGKRRELIVRLEELSDDDVNWTYDLLSVAMKATGRRNFEQGASSPKPRVARAKPATSKPKRRAKQ